MATATHNTLTPAIQGLEYALLRIETFIDEGYAEYPLAITWGRLVAPLRDTLSFLEEGNIHKALEAVSLLRLFDKRHFNLELLQSLKSFEYLEKGLRFLVSGDEENAFLTLSDFWLTQQHFWHTNSFLNPSFRRAYGQRALTSKKVVLHYSRTVVTYVHVLLLSLLVAAAVYVLTIEPRTWVGVVTCGLVIAFNIYITSTSPTPAITSRFGWVGLFIAEVAISMGLLALSTHNGFAESLRYVAVGVGIAWCSAMFFVAPLGWGRYEKNLGKLDLFSCYWVRSHGDRKYEVVVTDGSGKITQRDITKHSEDVLDAVSAGVIAEMCKPGYGALGALSKKETSLWYKYYPRISSLRYVKRRDKTSAKMFFRFFPGWFIKYRKWSPFVFTDDALLSTPGLTEESLREYFASNPPCCEPAGYEKFTASGNTDRK